MMENCSTSAAVDWHGAKEALVLQPAPSGDCDAGSGVISVLAAAEELGHCHSLEALLRRAVELGRDCIGLERVSLFLHDEAHGVLRGTWGTGAKSELVDERHLQRAFGEVEREAHRRVEAGVGRWLQLRDAPQVSYEESGKAVLLGHGWQVLTPLRSLRAPVGMLYNDAARSRTPLDPIKQVRAAVFASLIGNLIEATREPAQLTRGLPQAGAKYGALVRKAIAALNEDPTISADRLAARLSVSSARLARAFRAELSLSLVQYRNRLRLERFFGLVEHRGGNFSDAAHTAGFGSYAQFHRIFRQHLGVTPREYLTNGRAPV
jgi:AraC-like DNA-binding protein